MLGDLYDAFVERLTPRFAALPPGDPADPATTLRPLASTAAAERLAGQVETPSGRGRRCDRRPAHRPGAFLEATS